MRKEDARGMKAYIVSDTEKGTDNIDGIYYLITEKGEILASHWCSNIVFARGDLYYNRPERIREFAEKFGTFEVDYLGNDNMTQSELLKRNKNFYADYPIEKVDIEE